MKFVWRGITLHFRSRWPEWCLALILIGQALQLLSSRNLAANRVYRVIISMVAESSLGICALSVGCAWLVALTLNGTVAAFRRASPWSRAGLALMASCYWALWSVTLYQATDSISSVAWINHAGFSLMAGVCFVMCAREIAYADERVSSCRNRPTTG